MPENILKIESNLVPQINTLRGKLSFLEHRELPFAMAKALTDSMTETKVYLKGILPAYFHNPSSFTINSIYSTMATKQNLFAEVGFKDIMRHAHAFPHYLMPNTIGGNRPQKASEYILTKDGILGKGEELVPTIYAQEAKSSIYEQILSGLGAMRNIVNANKSMTGRHNYNTDFVAGTLKGHGSVWAIWQRRGDQIIPMFFKVSHTNYPKRFPFYQLANEYVHSVIQANMDDAMRYALNTAGLDGSVVL